LQIPVSIVDLVASAMHQGQSVADNYRENYSLGLVPHDRLKGFRAVCLRLKKPCPYLVNDLCTIYSIRPLPCILFPENLAYEGELAERAHKEELKDFLCLHRPVALSPDRGEIIAKLQAMWERESLISSYYLFEEGSCYIDTPNLTREMWKAATDCKALGSDQARETQDVIPNYCLEHFFFEHINAGEPFAGADEKIHQLDGLEGLNRFSQLMQDHMLARKIKKREKTSRLLLRFANGKLKVKRRSLIPAVYSFYS
jgi:Fe-S-cluster containining protein